MRATCSRILRIVLLAVISLVIGSRLYLWNARTLVGNAMPMPFGYGISVVLSGSMEPALSVNDIVLVRSQKSYAVGDVVVYQDGNALVIHRIIRIDEDTVVTQGDANAAADPPIHADDIKGRELLRIPLIGAVVRFLKTPVGFLLMLLCAVVLFELPYYRSRRKNSDEQEKIKAEIERLKGE